MTHERYPLVDVNGTYACDDCGDLFSPPTDTSYRAHETVCPRCRGEEPERSIGEGSALSAYVRLIISEQRVREADVSDGSRVPHGSSKHVKDLESRIAGLVQWRDKQKRGSEARANYSRLVSRLKGELASARRTASKKKPIKESPGDELAPQERWQLLADDTSDPAIATLVNDIRQAPGFRDLTKTKKNIEKMMDAGELPKAVTDGFIAWLCDQRKAQLSAVNHQERSSSDARTDRLLRVRDSSGKAKSRK